MADRGHLQRIAGSVSAPLSRLPVPNRAACACLELHTLHATAAASKAEGSGTGAHGRRLRAAQRRGGSPSRAARRTGEEDLWARPVQGREPKPPQPPRDASSAAGRGAQRLAGAGLARQGRCPRHCLLGNRHDAQSLPVRLIKHPGSESSALRRSPRAASPQHRSAALRPAGEPASFGTFVQRHAPHGEVPRESNIQAIAAGQFAHRPNQPPCRARPAAKWAPCVAVTARHAAASVTSTVRVAVVACSALSVAR
jgi:hypothetical protein